MENELDIALQEKYMSLPQELQDFIVSEDVKNIISETLNGQPLQQKQIDIFGRELMFVLLGLETVSSFTDNIKVNMEISISRAEELSRNIKQKIFVPFQDALMLEEPQEESEDRPTREERSIPNEIQQPPLENNQHVERVEEVGTETPVPQKESVDIFKKRLSESVHTPIEQKIIADKQQNRPEPASHEDLTSDTYRETPV